jgi:hypothetical protein|nr:MAG TPA: Regulatory protein [Caudoviricetes sp.]
MRFKDFLEKENISLEKAAAELGISYEDARRYRLGLVIPRKKNMKKIFEWSRGRVTANDFYLTEDK